MVAIWRSTSWSLKAYLLASIVAVGLAFWLTMMDALLLAEQIKEDPSIRTELEEAGAVGAAGPGAIAGLVLLPNVFGLFFFYKTLQGRRWAWVVLLILTVLSLSNSLQYAVGAVYGFLFTMTLEGRSALSLSAFALNIGCVWLLLHRDTRKHLGAPRTVPPSAGSDHR